MADEFSVGEIAILVQGAKRKARKGEKTIPRGSEVTILSPLQYWNIRGLGEVLAHKIISQDGIEYGALPAWLRKRKPPGEQKKEQTGEWDLCPWKPGLSQTV